MWVLSGEVFLISVEVLTPGSARLRTDSPKSDQWKAGMFVMLHSCNDIHLCGTALEAWLQRVQGTTGVLFQLSLAYL